MSSYYPSCQLHFKTARGILILFQQITFLLAIIKELSWLRGDVRILNNALTLHLFSGSKPRAAGKLLKELFRE